MPGERLPYSPAGSVEEARHMKQVHPEYLLIGERRGRRCEGFDYGNSPSQTRNADLSGKKSYILQAREHRES